MSQKWAWNPLLYLSLHLKIFHGKNDPVFKVTFCINQLSNLLNIRAKNSPNELSMNLSWQTSNWRISNWCLFLTWRPILISPRLPWIFFINIFFFVIKHVFILSQLLGFSYFLCGTTPQLSRKFVCLRRSFCFVDSYADNKSYF